MVGDKDWPKRASRLPGWLVERLTIFRTVLRTVETQLAALTTAVAAQVGKARVQILRAPLRQPVRNLFINDRFSGRLTKLL